MRYQWYNIQTSNVCSTVLKYENGNKKYVIKTNLSKCKDNKITHK